MAELEITLLDGITSKATNDGAETIHTQCTLRELTCGDILDAEVESERVHLLTVEGVPQPHIVSSPALMNAHMLRRQIKKLGKIHGPLSLELFKKLSPRDLDAVRAAGDRLTEAGAKKGMADGGRMAPGAAAD